MAAVTFAFVEPILPGRTAVFSAFVGNPIKPIAFPRE